MKKFLCTLALVLCASASAQAQVYFAPGSTKPINPGAANSAVRAHAPVKASQRLVRCRDGSRHTMRACRGHGGTRR
jgi:hypothetical protein